MVSVYSNNVTTVSEKSTKPFEKETKERLTKRFSREEDEKLISLVQTYGAKKWNYIANFMGNRNAKQCRERWDIRKANQIPFTSLEEKIIMESHSKGEKWAKIALKLGNGRTSNDIKNAFNQRLSK
ncbi:13514_t:CDS:2, partial [Racocetra persica]